MSVRTDPSDATALDARTQQPDAPRIAPSPEAVPAATARPVTGGRSTSRADGTAGAALAAPNWQERVTGRLALGDAMVTTAAVGLAVLAAERGASSFSADMTVLIVVAAITLILWNLTLALRKTRDLRILGHGGAEFTGLITSTLLVFGAMGVIGSTLDAESLRYLPIVAFPIGLCLLLLHRVIARERLARLRERNLQCVEKIALVGGREEVARIHRELRREPRAGYWPSIAILPDGNAQAEDGEEPLLMPAESTGTSAEDVLEVLDRHPEVDAVAVLSARTQMEPTEVRRLSWEVDERGMGMIMASNLTDVAEHRLMTESVGGAALLHVCTAHMSPRRAAVKRSMDIVLSSLGLLVLAPLFAVIALAIKLEGRGPVFFHQERVGSRHCHFRMHKFRSMVVDAEARLDALHQARDEKDEGAGNGVLFKMECDPRVTRTGAFLRKYSLDELPQLWNVLKGQMSMVGPRPALRREVDLYERDAHRRLIATPGITGLWQVSGRSDLSWDDSVRLDLYYVENWSLMGDIAILFRTLKVVVLGSGAY